MAYKDILTRSQALLSGFLVMFLLIFSSCDKLIDLLEGGDDEEENAIIEIPYSPTSWEVSYKGQTVSVEFTASEDWRIVIDEYTSSWISVSPTEGSAGDYTLDISVSANETSEQRNGFVTIYSGDERVDIYVTQYGFETVLDVPDSQTYWDISNEETALKVNLITNVDWSVEIEESTASWVSVDPSKGTAGEYVLDIHVSANETEEMRHGMLTVVSGNERREIYINQKGKTFQPEGEGPDDMPIEEWK